MQPSTATNNNKSNNDNKNDPTDVNIVSELSLFDDGYVSLGKGKCRSENELKPSYYQIELSPLVLKMDDPHGICRSICDSDNEHCLGYVYHTKGIYKHSCLIYVTSQLDIDSILVTNLRVYERVNNRYEFILADSAATNIITTEEWETNDVFGYCFVKLQAISKPEIKETCVHIIGFNPNPNTLNVPELKGSVLKAFAAFNDPISVDLKQDSINGDICWSHAVFDFKFSFYAPKKWKSFFSNDRLLAQTSEMKGDKEGIFTLQVKAPNVGTETFEIETYGELTVKITIRSDHFGCCYETLLEENKALVYNSVKDVTLSQCAVNNMDLVTLFSYDMKCNQLKSLVPEMKFKYVGNGGCRDANNLSPARYWHNKLEFHTCQLACITDDTCLGLVYFHSGKWHGRFVSCFFCVCMI